MNIFSSRVVTWLEKLALCWQASALLVPLPGPKSQNVCNERVCPLESTEYHIKIFQATQICEKSSSNEGNEKYDEYKLTPSFYMRDMGAFLMC